MGFGEAIAAVVWTARQAAVGAAVGAADCRSRPAPFICRRSSMSPTAAPRLPALLHLPRQLFIAVFGVLAFTTAGGVVYGLLTAPTGRYAQLAALWDPVFLVSVLESICSSALLPALIAWSVAHNRVERCAGAIRPAIVRAAFVASYLVLYLVQLAVQAAYGAPISTFLAHWALQALPSSSLPASLALQLGAATLVYAAIDIALVLIALWLAFAIGTRRGAASAAMPAPAAPVPHSVAILCALFVLAIEWKFQFAADQVFYEFRSAHPWTAIGAVTGPLVVYGLAYWGARRGVGRPAQMRPWRALGASVVTTVVLWSACFAAGIAWAIGAAAFSDGYDPSENGILALIGFIGVLWLVLSVVLMRWFAGIFYDRFQGGADSGVSPPSLPLALAAAALPRPPQAA